MDAGCGARGSSKCCSRCGEVKDVSLFYARRARGGRPHAWCKACHRAYYAAKGPAYNNRFQNKLRAEKQRHVRARKVALGCADCGARHVACLEYHHPDPAQKAGTVWQLAQSNASYERIEAEMAKCVVLCANCHRIRHYNERQARKRRAA